MTKDKKPYKKKLPADAVLVKQIGSFGFFFSKVEHTIYMETADYHVGPVAFARSEILDLFDNNPRIGYVVMTNVAASIRGRLAHTTKKLSVDWLSSGGPASSSSSSWGEPGKR